MFYFVLTIIDKTVLNHRIFYVRWHAVLRDLMSFDQESQPAYALVTTNVKIGAVA